MTSAPKIYKLDQTINLFNQGCASFQRALEAKAANNFSEAETALIGAARDIADSLEWAMKVYLQNFPKLSSEARRKLRHPNFNDLINLMKMYSDPPLDVKTGQQMYGYRDMRNEATHKGAIPPVSEVQNAVDGVSTFLRTYLGVEESQLRQNVETKITTNPPQTDLTERNDMNNALSEENFDLSTVRRHLNQLFDAAQFDAFCLEHFPEVYDTFGRGMRKDEKITLLLDHCRRYPERRQSLLDLLRHEEEKAQRKPVVAPSRLTPSQHRRKMREKQDLENHIETISKRISELRRQLTLENRVEEIMRIEARIEDDEKLRAEFEDKLEDVEKQLGG